MDLHPEILVKNGKKEFAVPTYEEYLAIQERLVEAGRDLDVRAGRQTH